MTEPALSKQHASKIGRSFALLFNRASMYDVNHPFTKQSTTELYKALAQGLKELSPIVFIMAQEQFFVEEEPLDSRINTTKMLSHFKNGGIQSVSFGKGLKETDLKTFSKVFFDTARYVDADAMKTALANENINKVKINHVFFKKVTENDEVVTRDSMNEAPTVAGSATQPQFKGKTLDMLAESVLMQELEKSLTLKNLMDNPSGMSKAMINADLEVSKDDQTQEDGSGPVILQQLRHIGAKVDEAASGKDGIGFDGLAEAVFDMKKDLLEGIEAQKSMGVVYQNEGLIREETNEITDKVIIQLVTEEYKKGQISVPRLGQILRRLVPEVGELRRLLPKLKEALVAEGMPLSEFAQLGRELGKELQNEELAQVFEQSAQEIGISGDELIQEINLNPKGAAELIYLASEIRKGTGDEKVLTNLLVDYVESVGSNIAMETADQKGEEGGGHLRKIISQVESQLVNQLKTKNIDPGVLQTVEERLTERMEECLGKLESNWNLKKTSSSNGENTSSSSALRIFEESVEDGDELKKILEQVRTNLKDKGADENDYQKIYEEISKTKPDAKKISKTKPVVKKAPPKGGLPQGILNRGSTLFFIEKEISRSIRYDTPFSTLIFSIIKVTPQKPVPRGSVKRDDITNIVLTKLMSVVRDTDIIGLLDKKKIMTILPMSDENDAKMALRRILKVIHDQEYELNGIPLVIKFASAVTGFDKDRTPSLKAFIKRTESDILNMENRLKNIQALY
jgi:hypothetical protein